MQLGVIANFDKPSAVSALREVDRLAVKLGIQLVCSPTHKPHLPSALVTDEDRVAGRAGMIMVLGGDGTMLSAARSLQESDIPLIGVNLGKLGFMTSVTEERLEEALSFIAQGNYRLSERSRIACRIVRKGAQETSIRALNDVVLGWGSSPRVATLRVEVNGTMMTTYTCDGIIASTPTGSTGHALSAGGPIIHPETPALLLTVICPHTLSVRPVVLPDQCTVTIHVEGAKSLLLSVDGRNEPDLNPGDRLVIRRSKRGIRLVELPGQDYFRVLREKLGWRGSNLPG